MTRQIHPSAVIDRRAELAEDVIVEAYAVIGPHVTVGAGTRVRAHAYINGRSRIGGRCDIYPHAVIGAEPQDLKYKGEDSELIIGDGNIFREFTSIHRGTELGGGKTVIGDNNLFMAYVHVAHDCIIGNRCILSNCVQLAGHICLEDMAILSGMVAIHHFVTVGTMAFLAGMSAVRKDIPPYMTAEGNPARVRHLNLEGLRRRELPAESIKALKEVFRLVYRSDLNRRQAIEKLQASDLLAVPEVKRLIDHYHASEAGHQGRAREAFRADRKPGTRRMAKADEGNGEA